MESKPAEVLKAKQARETQTQCDMSWAEPAVWTDNMLTALNKGVKGGKWFSLIDKVSSQKNLIASWKRVKANKGKAGVDYETIQMFESSLDENLFKLSNALKEKTYTPQAIRRVQIPKPGSTQTRPLGIPTVRDRVVQTALRNVIEPIFEATFADSSFGFRPKRGCKDALRKVDALLKDGYRYVVDADLESFFDTIPRDRLMSKVKEEIADSQVLKLIEAFLNQKVMEGCKEWIPEHGTPQGAVISPVLANIYLNPMDHRMAEKGYEMIRYADDFVILCKSKEEADMALEEVKQWVNEAGLTLHPDKTRVANAVAVGFDFLGYHFKRGKRWPSKKSIKKLKDALRSKTRRAHGHSLSRIITDVNKTTKGWFEYFKHSQRPVMKSLDQWIRLRLRSILRKRSGRKGRGRGWDCIRWTNAFFANHGLFILTDSHALAVQSVQR